mmetsp:Transcript_25401/g.73106  ORF Transcript_25401/g.73106 Transcript_25401/m.73106 type:complete len:202 (-) Transcript_25401:479-1084(-)
MAASCPRARHMALVSATPSATMPDKTRQGAIMPKARNNPRMYMGVFFSGSSWTASSALKSATVGSGSSQPKSAPAAAPAPITAPPAPAAATFVMLGACGALSDFGPVWEAKRVGVSPTASGSDGCSLSGTRMGSCDSPASFVERRAALRMELRSAAASGAFQPSQSPHAWSSKFAPSAVPDAAAAAAATPDAGALRFRGAL